MASNLSLEQLERQLLSQDSELDEQAGAFFQGPAASRLTSAQHQTPTRSSASSSAALRASPMSPSARARASLIKSSSHKAATGAAGPDDSASRPADGSRNAASVGEAQQLQRKQPVDESLPVESQLKMLRSQIRIASAEIESIACARDEWKARCAERDASLATAAATSKQRQAEANTHKKRAENHKQVLDKLQTSNKSLDAEVSALRSELSSLRRTEKSSDAGAAALQARLQRALEEKGALKEENVHLKANLRRGDESAELKQLRAANRELQRQKAEVLAGFKAALKLVDVLKRQKVHIEAARLLAFSEDEFARSLESGAALLDAANK